MLEFQNPSDHHFWGQVWDSKWCGEEETRWHNHLISLSHHIISLSCYYLIISSPSSYCLYNLLIIMIILFWSSSSPDDHLKWLSCHWAMQVLSAGSLLLTPDSRLSVSHPPQVSSWLILPQILRFLQSGSVTRAFFQECLVEMNVFQHCIFLNICISEMLFPERTKSELNYFANISSVYPILKSLFCDRQASISRAWEEGMRENILARFKLLLEVRLLPSATPWGDLFNFVSWHPKSTGCAAQQCARQVIE